MKSNFIRTIRLRWSAICITILSIPLCVGAQSRPDDGPYPLTIETVHARLIVVQKLQWYLPEGNFDDDFRAKVKAAVDEKVRVLDEEIAKLPSNTSSADPAANKIAPLIATANETAIRFITDKRYYDEFRRVFQCLQYEVTLIRSKPQELLGLAKATGADETQSKKIDEVINATSKRLQEIEAKRMKLLKSQPTVERLNQELESQEIKSLESQSENITHEQVSKLRAILTVQQRDKLDAAVLAKSAEKPAR